MTNQTTQDSEAYIAPGDAARIAFVTTKTLGRMAERGDIRSFTLPSGHRRYSREDVEALAAGEATAADEHHSPTKNAGAA